MGSDVNCSPTTVKIHQCVSVLSSDSANGVNSIASIIDGTTPVAKATNADSAASADKLSTSRTISLLGDATGSASFDGSDDSAITVVLTGTGVAEGSYSAVSVDTKGRVTAGAQFIEVGATGQELPKATLATGGIFYKEI